MKNIIRPYYFIYKDLVRKRYELVLDNNIFVDHWYRPYADWFNRFINYHINNKYNRKVYFYNTFVAPKFLRKKENGIKIFFASENLEPYLKYINVKESEDVTRANQYFNHIRNNFKDYAINEVDLTIGCFVNKKSDKYIRLPGGEEGALNGPALMPGGNKESYKEIKEVLEAISAKAEDGKPCCTYIGENGAGHYVKMVHNGIEYADMQLIAEAYLLLKHVGGYENFQIADIFNEWNQGELNSFLIGITADIFKEKDDLGEGELVDKILDSAGQKGTGRWTSLAALEQGVNTSIMTSACNARNISSFYEKRQQLAESGLKKVLPVEIDADFVEDVRRSLYTAKIAAYAQGLALYKSASETYDWNLNLGDIASIFRAGCIIQARFLNNITNAYQQEPNLDNLIENEFFAEKVKNNQQCLRKIVAKAILAGVPVPAFANAISYIDGLSTKVVGANLIQAQRDYFGAHTYKRIDREGSFHHQWQKHFDR